MRIEFDQPIGERALSVTRMDYQGFKFKPIGRAKVPGNRQAKMLTAQRGLRPLVLSGRYARWVRQAAKLAAGGVDLITLALAKPNAHPMRLD